MADTDQGSDKKSRKRIIMIALVVIIALIAWQAFGLFGGGSAQVEETKPAVAAPPPPPMPTPKPAELPKAPAPLTQREVELMQLQQQTEANYLAALNELQILKVQRDIAQTNKDIASAKLDTVNAQKNIVTLLTPENANINYAQRLTNQTQGAPVSAAGPPPAPVIEIAYTVISVSEIQGRWGAVIGAQGKLYNVHVGDVLPSDNSRVISINRSGVVLEKNGAKKTVSLVPII